MLRIGLVNLRPITITVARSPQVFRPSLNARTFTTFRSNVLEALGKRSNGYTKFSSTFFQSAKRGFMTDGKTIAARPPQTEAWKRYAITFVSPLHDL